MNPLIPAACLLALAGCTTIDATYPTANGPAQLHVVRVFSATALGLSPDGTLSYSSDPNATMAADLMERGLSLGMSAATGGVLPPRLVAREPGR